MYPNYPCRNAQSCCNDMVGMDNCCNLGRNISLIDCCPPRRRLQDFRVFESRPRAPKCKGLAHTLSEAKQQAKMIEAAEAMEQQQQSVCSNPKSSANTRNGPSSKCTSKPSCQQQAANKQSPYQTTSYYPSSANPCSLKSQDSNQSSCYSGTGPCSGKKSTRRRSKEKDPKVNSNQSIYLLPKADSGCSSKKCATQCQSQNQKYLKNKQNYQCQDDFDGKRRRMEVICEEQEEMMGSDDDESCLFSGENGKKIQESCADFLNIVNDSVLDTVQKSVECILKDYFMHTLEKIECLCAQMVRNDCLMSKMYLDIMDKISQSNDKNQRQFKCLCQFLIDTRKVREEPQEQQEPQELQEPQSKRLSKCSPELECVQTCPTKTLYTCPCGCKRVGGLNLSKDAKRNSVSSHSSQTEEDKGMTNESPKAKRTGNATPDMTARKSDKRASSGYDEEVPKCHTTSLNTGDENKNNLSNNSSWNSAGTSTSNCNTSYNSDISRNLGLADTLITEEIRYFRNQSRIVPNGLDNLGCTLLQPDAQPGNCCGQPTNQANMQTAATRTIETRTCSGRNADAACKDVATDYCPITLGKATRSEKRRRSSDFPNTRSHKKKRTLR